MVGLIRRTTERPDAAPAMALPLQRQPTRRCAPPPEATGTMTRRCFAGLPGWQRGGRRAGPARRQERCCRLASPRSADAELPGGGWPAGALIELLADRPGIGELSLPLPLLGATPPAR